jgi:hypothetical protein
MKKRLFAFTLALLICACGGNEKATDTPTNVPPTNNDIGQFKHELPPEVTPATAVAVVTPTETPTRTPRPSATPTRTPPSSATPTATLSHTPTGVPPYDDFENKAFDGSFDTSLFHLAFDNRLTCAISQEDGVLRIQKGSEVNDFLNCSLLIERPASVKSTRLEDMYASMHLGSDHNGNLVTTMLTVDARFDDINVTWLAECGIGGDANGPFAAFAVFHIQRGQRTDIVYGEQKFIRYDQWYRLGLQVDHNDSSLHCLVDGEELGSYSLLNDQYAERLANVRFLRWISNGFDREARGTILLDDFYLIPPQ